MKFIKYPSIDSLKNLVKGIQLHHDYKGKDETGENIYEHTSPYPTFQFKGTVKAHGTNSGIIRYKDGSTVYQSRERELSLLSDNAGFAAAMMGTDIEFLFEQFPFNEYIAIYGEWCGGNIQKGVALNQISKRLIIFGIKVDDVWVEIPSTLFDVKKNIYNVLQFPTYEIEIDFNTPEDVLEQLTNITNSIEKCCPIGKFFGVEGTGEGAVYVCTTNPDIRFKVKGAEHAVSKTKNVVDVVPESLEGINDFVELTVTENRLEQGLKWLKSEVSRRPESKHTGDFVKWIVSDVFKEESDTIVANKLDAKKIRSAVSVKARNWFLNSI